MKPTDHFSMVFLEQSGATACAISTKNPHGRYNEYFFALERPAVVGNKIADYFGDIAEMNRVTKNKRIMGDDFLNNIRVFYGNGLPIIFELIYKVFNAMLGVSCPTKIYA